MTDAALILFALDEIIGHLGTAVVQRAPSDDAIIADHIVCALAHAKAARASLLSESARCRDVFEENVRYGGMP